MNIGLINRPKYKIIKKYKKKDYQWFKNKNKEFKKLSKN